MPVGRLLGFSEPLFTGIDACRFDKGVSVVRWSSLVVSIRRRSV